MRFIGSKRLLVDKIEDMLKKNVSCKSLRTFCDIFSGTSVVGRYFKKYFRVISNDILYFSYVLQRAGIQLNMEPSFEGLKKINISNPLDHLNNIKINYDNDMFVLDNYTPSKICERKYLSNLNGALIDTQRITLDDWVTNNYITQDEYFYLLCSIIEAVPFVSNIAGTYGAYLKNWDKRSFKKLELFKPELYDNNKRNISFNKNSDELIQEIYGDILYIDPPYNSRQYMPNYHLLETIAKYDKPNIKGVTGIREYKNEKSLYCNKSAAEDALNDLISNAKFKYIILSYSNEGIIDEKKLNKLIKSHSTSLYTKSSIPYRRYKKNKNQTKQSVNELIYIIDKKT